MEAMVRLGEKFVLLSVLIISGVINERIMVQERMEEFAHLFQ